MKKAKRIASAVLSAMLVLSTGITGFPNGAFEEVAAKDNIINTMSIPPAVQGSGWELAINADGAYTVTFNGTSIPASFIESEAVAPYKDKITKVVIGSKVRSIGDSAFKDCVSLRDVKFEENSVLKETGCYVFDGCKNLRSVNPEALSALEYVGTKDSDDSGTFNGTALVSVTIPSTVKEIGDGAFCYSKLEKVNFEENHVLTKLGKVRGEVFSGCTELTEINLENIKSSSFSFGTNIGWEPGFYGCSSLVSVTVPGNISGNLSKMFYDCTSLEEIVFKENTNKITDVNDIIRNTKVEELDLSPLNITEITGTVVKDNSSLRTLKLPDTVEKISAAADVAVNCSNLREILWEKNEHGPEFFGGGKHHFAENTALESFDFENLPDLTKITDQMFKGDVSLKQAVLGGKLSSIGSEAFSGCTGLKEVVYKTSSLSNVSSDAFANTGDFTLKITAEDGSFPTYINTDFLAAAQGHISDIIVDKNVSFTVGTEGKGNALSAPFTKGGMYCTDSSGSIYKVNGDTAELVYGARDTDTLTIPASVSCGGKSLPVTAIGRDAFKGSTVQSLTFSGAAQITNIDDYAFANAENLSSVNGETESGAVTSSFAAAAGSLGSNLFVNTKITGDKEEKVFENSNVQNNGTIGGSIGFGIEISLDNDTEQRLEPKEKALYYTGTEAQINVALSQSPVNVYRIYVRKESDGIVSCSTGAVLQPTEDPDIWYYEFTYESGSTYVPTINVKYPNCTRPGRKMQVWGVSVSNEVKEEYANKVIEPGTTETGIVTTDAYIEPTWITQNQAFQVAKEAVESSSVGFNAVDKGIALKNLKFQVKYSPLGETYEKAAGNDFVKYVDLKDTLKLPTYLKWRSDIDTDNTTVVSDGSSSSLYAVIGGKKYLVCTVSNFNLSNAAITDMWLEKDGENNYTVCFRTANTETDKEISPLSGDILFGSEVIFADGIKPNEEIKIDNTISSETNYNFAEKVSDTAEANVSFNSGSGNVLFDKSIVTKPGHMGEDAEFKLTVENPSAFDYDKLEKLEDTLSGPGNQAMYIKPENMQALFDGIDGDNLTITITNAFITDAVSDTVTGLDGETEGKLSAANTGKDTEYNGLKKGGKTEGEKITITKENGIITIASGSKTITADGGKTIADALNELAYVVTQEDYYTLTWDYPSVYTLNAGEKLEYNVKATVKNSLMFLPEQDSSYYYNYPTGKGVDLHNEASLTAGGNVQRKSTETVNEVPLDLRISKDGTVDGVSINPSTDENKKTHRVELGDIIDYKVDLAHMGKSYYDVLPVTDKLAGLQCLLVPVEDNPSLAGEGLPKLTEEDGIEYYVLNQPGTYEDIVIGGICADTVTVKELSDNTGIETLIKYYIIDKDPEAASGIEGDRNISFTYKAVCDDQYFDKPDTSHFSINNEAWANDLMGHRIYAPIFTGGAALAFSKDIVAYKSSDPQFDEIDKDDFSTISREKNIVTYRLKFENPFPPESEGSDNPKTHLTGKDFYDALPATGTAFDWSKSNISVDYELKNGATFVDGRKSPVDKEEVLDGNEWNVVKDDPSSLPSTGHDADSQYITWNDDITVEFPPKSQFYIYVTLTFPDEEDVWNSFITEKGGEILINTLYLYNLPDRVTHSLSEPGKVLLQKGVYETGYYTRGALQDYTEYYRGIDRYHYTPNDPYFLGEYSSEQKGAVNTVTYYIIIKNSGKTPLYLTDVYDVLPKGFDFYTLSNSAVNHNLDKDIYTKDFWSSSHYVVGLINDIGKKDSAIERRYIPTAPGYLNWEGKGRKMAALVALPEGYRNTVGERDAWESPVDVNGEYMQFVLTHVGYDGEEVLPDGRKRIKFHFVRNDIGGFNSSGSYYNDKNDNIKIKDIDEYKNVPYLSPGEFTQFAYTVYTASDEVAQDKALNYAAMEYIDIDGGGDVTLDTDTGVDVADYNGMENNDGDRELWDNTKAAKEGFTEVSPLNKADNRQWLVSGVTVEKGDIVPGITKTASSDSVRIEASAGTPVNWTVTSRNNGNDAMTDYVISDTLEPEFIFEGDVKYEIHGKTGPVSNEEAKRRNDCLLKCGINVQAPNPNVINQVEDAGRGPDVMFHIDRDESDMSKLLVSSNTVYEGKGTPVTVVANNKEWTPIPYIYFYDTKNTGHLNGNILAGAYVKFEKKENTQGKECETLKIRFAYKVNDTTVNKAIYAIPAGGYSILTVGTTANKDIKAGMYLNDAYIIPSDLQQDFNQNYVSQGKPVELDAKNAVKSTAPVNLYTGQPTLSYKEIEEVLNEENRADSRNPDSNYILLSDKTKTFRYTLNITNSGDKPMDKLVVIDNLPQLDDNVTVATADGNTLRDDLKRYSEFKVSLAKDDPNFEIKIVKDDGSSRTLTKEVDYKVQYSTKTGDFTSSDWLDKDAPDSPDWKPNREDLTDGDPRSVRFVIEKDGEGNSIVTSGDTVKISFDAVINDENAKPSQTAWNSFGYSYSVNDLTAKAAPLNVGVRIPSAPQIKKAIVTGRGGLSPIDKDRTFRFLIYKGNKAAEFDDYTENGLAERLAPLWSEYPDYTLLELSVEEGRDKSDIFDISTLCKYGISDPAWGPTRYFTKTETPWVWEDGKTYYIVEIDDPLNEDLSFFGINGRDQRQYKFVYDASRNEEITVSNAKPDWNIRILKHDQNGDPLQGALFGIYTPNEDEKMSDEQFAALGIDEEYKTRTVLNDGRTDTYYLMDTAVSNENGALGWGELGEDTYVVYEITPPIGYYGSLQNYIFTREEAVAASDKTQPKIVVNREAEPLPGTGGKGILPVMILGAVISMTALMLLYLRKKKAVG